MAKLVAEQVMEGHRLAKVFGAAAAAGYDLAEVLDILYSPRGHHLDEGEAAEVDEAYHGYDVLFELVECVGLDAAAEAASRSQDFAEVDVRAHYTSYRAQLRARTAIMDEVPVATTFGLVTDAAVSDTDRRWLLESMTRVYALEELAQITDQVREEDAATIGAMLRKQSALEALETMLPELAPDTVLVMLETYWNVPRQPGQADAALVRTYAALCRSEFRPLRHALGYAAGRGEPDWWLPLLREQGFKGAQAALHLLESGTGPLAIAQLLSEAGYADEDVLTALLENGIGTRTSLATLRDSGWRLDAMVKALAERGELLPEVRRHLLALGVPLSAQRQVLVGHWPTPVVDLVIESQLTPRLPGAGEPD